MIAIPEILNQNIFGVSIKRLMLFFIIILLTFIARSVLFYIIDKKIIALVRRTKTEFYDQVINAVRNPLGYLIMFHGFYLAIISLELPEKIGLVDIKDIVHAIYILGISFIMLYFIFKIIDIIAFYLAIREQFNLKIMQLLEELGVEIAFPSQMIYLNGIKRGN